ncbi:MAG: HEAT repeat domain-containing protein [Chloroflexota bacterium]
MNFLNSLFGKKSTDEETIQWETNIQLDLVDESNLVNMLKVIASHKGRIWNAEAIFKLNQEQRIYNAAKHKQGLTVFDLTSSSKGYELNADDVRRLAKSGLPNFRDSVYKSLTSVENDFVNLIQSKKKESVRNLIAICSNEKKYDENVIRTSRLYLQDHLGQNVVDELVSSFRESDKNMRFEIIRLLGQLYFWKKVPSEYISDVIETLIAALKDSDLDVRFIAAVSFKDIKDSRAIEPLRNVSQNRSEDSRIRDQASKALRNQES